MGQQPARWRVGCAYIPQFELRVALNAQPLPNATTALALIHPGPRAQVAAVNAAARLEGIQPGQTASRARARCADLLCRPWTPDTYDQAAQSLAELLEHAAPAVVPTDTLGLFWFDASGMGLLGGETPLATGLINAAAQAGFSGLRVAIADTAITARAIVLHSASPITCLPPGQDRIALGALPLHTLEIPAALLNTLRALGFERTEQIAALPAATLESRFGPAGRETLQRALAIDPRRPKANPTRTLPEVVQPIEPPVEHTAPLIFTLRRLLPRLSSQLIERGLAATELSLQLHLDDRSEITECLQPARPLHHPEPLFELCRDRLNAVSIDAPIVELRIQITQAQPIVPQQAHLGSSRWSIQALEGALNRLQGRFKHPVVFTAQPRDDVRPEAQGAWHAIEQVPLDANVPLSTRTAPVPAPIHRTLRTPIALAVRLDPQQHPRAIRSLSPCPPMGSGWHAVSAHGPERLSGHWWAETPFSREDYRLAIIPTGQILLVSRDTQGWWLRGWLD